MTQADDDDGRFLSETLGVPQDELEGTLEDHARRLRANHVRSLALRETYQRGHSPSGVYKRRIVEDPDTGEFKLLPEATHVEKPKRPPDDPRHVNLRNNPKGSSRK
jgi:hypothetical protein